MKNIVNSLTLSQCFNNEGKLHNSESSKCSWSNYERVFFVWSCNVAKREFLQRGFSVIFLFKIYVVFFQENIGLRGINFFMRPIQSIVVFTNTIRQTRMWSPWDYCGKKWINYFELHDIGKLIVRLFICNFK